MPAKVGANGTDWAGNCYSEKFSFTTPGQLLKVDESGQRSERPLQSHQPLFSDEQCELAACPAETRSQTVRMPLNNPHTLSDTFLSDQLGKLTENSVPASSDFRAASVGVAFSVRASQLELSMQAVLSWAAVAC